MKRFGMYLLGGACGYGAHLAAQHGEEGAIAVFCTILLGGIFAARWDEAS